MASYTLKYASVPESETLMLNDVLAILDRHQVDKETANRLSLMVSEAFNNAVIHGNQEQPDLSVALILHINESDISADVIDKGQGGLKQIKSRIPPEPHSEGGRGIDLIHHFASEVTFTEMKDAGLMVSFKIKREPKTVR
jgi:anti-sigma regulatory factor (Ser/Thr protein kinase)